MTTVTYRKQLVTKYEKKSIKELVSIYEFTIQELVKSYGGLADYEELTKIQIKCDVLPDIIQKKRDFFEIED
jgi:hypothetical protein